VAGQYKSLKKLCAGEECGCPLYPFKDGVNTLRGKNKTVEVVVCDTKIKFRNYTPLKAIRQRCIDCSGGDKKEVRECICYENNPEEVEPCPLWIYRKGKNPVLQEIRKLSKKGLEAFKKYHFPKKSTLKNGVVAKENDKPLWKPYPDKIKGEDGI